MGVKLPEKRQERPRSKVGGDSKKTTLYNCD